MGFRQQRDALTKIHVFQYFQSVKVLLVYHCLNLKIKCTKMSSKWVYVPPCRPLPRNRLSPRYINIATTQYNLLGHQHKHAQ
jgi:hypothetical protein